MLEKEFRLTLQRLGEDEFRKVIREAYEGSNIHNEGRLIMEIEMELRLMIQLI